MAKVKGISYKLVAIVSLFALVLTMFPMSAFAKEIDEEAINATEMTGVVPNEESGISPAASWVSVGTYGPGSYQIEYVNFKDKTNGEIRTYNGNSMQIKPAWKATDSTTSEVELLVKVIRKSNGDVFFEHRFKLYEDTDGHKDGDGWWYAESSWFDINNTSDYFFYYEVFTADGYQGTGNTRCGEVHLWIEVSDLYAKDNN